jgi:hypothetical protein
MLILSGIPIDPDDCIGDSLHVLNSSFVSLSERTYFILPPDPSGRIVLAPPQPSNTVLVSGDLVVTGNTHLEQDLTVDGDTFLKGNATVDGDLRVKGSTFLGDDCVNDAVIVEASTFFNCVPSNRALAVDGGNKLTSSTTTLTELDQLNGVTSNVQSQINNKQNIITGAATTITDANLSLNRALVSDSAGKVAASTTTSTQLGYLNNVTSDVQNQINGKVTSNPAITPGTHPKITYDAKGLVTGGAGLLAADIPNLDASKITTGAFGSTRIVDGSITNAKLENVPADTVKGRVGTAGPVGNLTAEQLRTLINVEPGEVIDFGYVHPNHFGDVASQQDQLTTINPNVVDNSKLAQVATGIIKGRKIPAGGGTSLGNVEDLTVSDVKNLLGYVSLSGDTMLGDLVLPENSDPADDTAIRKDYLDLRLQGGDSQKFVFYISAENFESFSRSSAARNISEIRKIVNAGPSTILGDTNNSGDVRCISNAFLHYYPYGTNTFDDGTKSLLCGLLPPRLSFAPSGILPLPHFTFNLPIPKTNSSLQMDVLCTSDKVATNFAGQTNPPKSGANSFNSQIYAVEMDEDNLNSGWIGGQFSTSPARIRAFSSSSIGSAAPTFTSLAGLNITNGIVYVLKFFKVGGTRYLAVGGSFTGINGASRLLIYNLSSGTIQKTFVLNNIVRCINFFDGKLYIGGRFNTFNDGTTHNTRGFAVVDTSSFTFDSTITVNLNLGSSAYMFLPSVDGSVKGEVFSIQKVNVGSLNLLFIAGYFNYRPGGTSASTTNRNIMAINMATNQRHDWNYGTNGIIYNTLLTTIGGTTFLSVMGSFTTSSENSNSSSVLLRGKSRFLRLSILADGTVSEDVYYPSFNSSVYEAIQVGNYILVRGAFTKVGNTAFTYLCYFDYTQSAPVAQIWSNGTKQFTNGSALGAKTMNQLQGSFTFKNVNPSGSPSTLSVSNPILIGGNFSKINSANVNRLGMFGAPPGLTISGDSPTQVALEISISKAEQIGSFIGEEGEEETSLVTIFDLPYQNEFEYITLNFPEDILESFAAGDVARVRIRRQKHPNNTPTGTDTLLIHGVKCGF